MWVVVPDLRRITWIYDVSESMPPERDPSKYHITIFGLGNIGQRRKLVLVHNSWFQARKIFIMGLTCVTRGRGGWSGGCDVTPPQEKQKNAAREACWRQIQGPWASKTKKNYEQTRFGVQKNNIGAAFLKHEPAGGRQTTNPEHFGKPQIPQKTRFVKLVLTKTKPIWKVNK